MQQSGSEVATPMVDSELDQTAKLATLPPEDETAVPVILFPHQETTVVSFFSFISLCLHYFKLLIVYLLL